MEFVVSDQAAAAAPVEKDENTLEVPLGAHLPVALVDDGVDPSPQVRAVLQSIADDFIKDIQAARAAGKNVSEAWDEAKAVADKRYTDLMGEEAYQANTLKAAREALSEVGPPVRPGAPAK